MHTCQGVAIPALSKDSARSVITPDNYEEDALRRAELHREMWQGEPLTPWQRFVLTGEVRR